MSTAPTYKEFCTLARGWTPKDLAPFVQADAPEQTAARILYHLDGIQSSKTGFSWDDYPLPYPILCEVYHRAELDRSLIEESINDTGQCRCGKPLTGRADAKCSSPLCRLHAFRQKGPKAL
jgi:hypothetical protein